MPRTDAAGRRSLSEVKVPLCDLDKVKRRVEVQSKPLAKKQKLTDDQHHGSL